MLLQQKPTKRHSFSIESLAISSRVEDNERDTDSPYLDYLQYKEACTDINSNVTSKTPAQVHYGMGSSHSQRSVVASMPQATSTPIADGNSRRRLCSTTTPPSSDESHFDDNHASDESTPMSIGDSNLAIDESSNMSSVGDADEKLSPAPSSASGSDQDRHMSVDTSYKRKKARTAFTNEQLRELEKRYKTQKYLTASDRSSLAKQLKLKDQQVKTWFQNRRMKEKRQQREDEQCQQFTLPTGGVDLAQLTALGICPPPYAHQLGTSSPLNHHFSESSSLSPNYPVPSTMAAGTDTSTAINRPIPSSVFSCRRNSVFTDLHSARSRNAEALNEGHYPTSSGIHQHSTSYPGLSLPGAHLPYPVLPNYTLPFINGGPQSTLRSPYLMRH